MIHDKIPHFADQHVRLIAEPVQQLRSRIANSDEWPMAAREREINSIVSMISTGRSVFLVGEAGVGKSRLLRVALDRATEQAFVAQVAAIQENGASIFSSLHELVGLYTAAIHDPNFCQLRENSGRNTTPGRIILGIDDAHLLHPVAAEFLYQLVMFDRATLVMTVRQDAPTPNGVSKLWLDRLAELIVVKPFTRSAVGEVLSARLGSYVYAETAERLHRATAGNALLLRELADHAIAEGNLRQVAGVWRWSDRLTCVDGRLVDVVRFHLDNLSSDETELIYIVALAESIELDLPIVAVLSHAAESLNRRGILVAERYSTGLCLKLTYPLYSHVVRATMPILTAFRLRMQLAEAIEQRVDGDPFDNRQRADALRFETGYPLAPERLLAAARLAVQRSDFTLAERLVRPILAQSRTHVHAAESAILLAKALAGQWQCEDAERILASASRTTAPPATLAQVVQARALNLALGLRRTNEAFTVIDNALKRLSEIDARPLHPCRTRVGILADRIREVAAEDEKLLSKEELQSELMQMMAPSVAFAHNALGDAKSALSLLNRCHAALLAWKVPNRLFHQLVTAQATFMMGQYAEACDVLDRLGQRIVDEHDSGEYPWFTFVRAQLARNRGRNSDAAEQFRRALTLPVDDHWLASRIRILAQLAGTLAEAGRLDEANCTLSEVRALQEGVSLPPMDVDAAALESAVVLAQADQRDRAAVLALEVAERCTVAGRLSQAIPALHLMARMGYARRVAERSAQLASSVTSVVLRAQTDHVLALANYDADGLARIGDRFAQCGMNPLAAEAVAQSCMAYRKAGRVRSAQMAEAKYYRLLSSCDINLPAWARFDTTSLVLSSGLTAREHEVTSYAASGLSNRDIANKLTISVRTVENHLQRAYSKLGISTRSDLALRLAASRRQP